MFSIFIDTTNKIGFYPPSLFPISRTQKKPRAHSQCSPQRTIFMYYYNQHSLKCIKLTLWDLSNFYYVQMQCLGLNVYYMMYNNIPNNTIPNLP